MEGPTKVSKKESENKDLVYIDEHGIMGGNFYWRRRKQANFSDEQLAEVGLTDERVLVHSDIIEPLKAVDRAFGARGCRLYIAEGYRSKGLYALVNKKMKDKIGEENTGRLLNMVDMPHATGKAVDVALWDPVTDKEIFLRDGSDGIDAYFIDFYKGKDDEKSKGFQELQEFVIKILQDNGFRLGTRREYFHFNYDPQLPRNY